MVRARVARSARGHRRRPVPTLEPLRSRRRSAHSARAHGFARPDQVAGTAVLRSDHRPALRQLRDVRARGLADVRVAALGVAVAERIVVRRHGVRVERHDGDQRALVHAHGTARAVAGHAVGAADPASLARCPTRPRDRPVRRADRDGVECVVPAVHDPVHALLWLVRDRTRSANVVHGRPASSTRVLRLCALRTRARTVARGSARAAAAAVLPGVQPTGRADVVECVPFRVRPDGHARVRVAGCVLHARRSPDARRAFAARVPVVLAHRLGDRRHAATGRQLQLLRVRSLPRHAAAVARPARARESGPEVEVARGRRPRHDLAVGDRCGPVPPRVSAARHRRRAAVSLRRPRLRLPRRARGTRSRPPLSRRSERGAARGRDPGHCWRRHLPHAGAFVPQQRQGTRSRMARDDHGTVPTAGAAVRQEPHAGSTDHRDGPRFVLHRARCRRQRSRPATARPRTAAAEPRTQRLVPLPRCGVLDPAVEATARSGAAAVDVRPGAAADGRRTVAARAATDPRTRDAARARHAGARVLARATTGDRTGRRLHGRARKSSECRRRSDAPRPWNAGQGPHPRPALLHLRRSLQQRTDPRVVRRRVHAA